MSQKAPAGIRLPWTGEMSPHGVLDILRGCNIACTGCYNTSAKLSPKPVAQVRAELKRLMELRRLHTVSLTGGEPLLHPHLDDIISHAKDCGLRTVLMTNGVLFDEPRAGKLRAAGLDMVLLHIQNRQNRPDIPPGIGQKAIPALRLEKAGIAAAAGLDTGFSALMYPDTAGHGEIRELLVEVAGSADVHFVMICPQGDFSIFSDLDGNIVTGYRHPHPVPGGLSSEESIAAQAEGLYGILRETGFGLFAWIGSSTASGEPRWSAWNAGVLRNAAGVRVIPLYPAWTDRLLLRLVHLLSGRHQFHSRASKARFRFQLALSLLGQRWGRATLPLLAGSFRTGTRLLRKHVVVELPPAQRQDGTIAICGECPDATVLNGRLVPPCLADRIPYTDTDGNHFVGHGVTPP